MTAGEPKPAFSLLMAVLAQAALVLGFAWSVLALLGGCSLLTQVPPAAVLGATAVSFAAVQLLMRRPRPLLLLLGADLLLTGMFVWIFMKVYGLETAAAAAGLGQSWVTAVLILMGAAILFALVFQLKWTAGSFRDTVMMLQLQVLLVSGVLQLWMADQLAVEAGWAAGTFLMAAGLLAGLTAAKTAGIHEGKDGGRGGLGARSGPAAAVLVFCGLAVGGAVAFAEPVGQAVSRGCELASGVLLGAASLVGELLKFLFLRNRIRLDESSASAAGGSGSGMEYIPVEEHNTDIFRILFHVVCIGLLLVVLVAAVRLLLQMTIGKGISLARKRSSRIQQEGTFRERLQAAVQELHQRMHAWMLMRKNPSSIAALLVWLERETGGSEELRRRPGETLRVFLLRLADRAEPAAAEALRRLADEADRACYGCQGNLMAEFSGSRAVRENFAKKR